MKKIDSCSMIEELASSPDGMKDMADYEDRPSSPELFSSKSPLDGDAMLESENVNTILTNDSLEEALNLQLANIEEEEEKPDKTKESEKPTEKASSSVCENKDFKVSDPHDKTVQENLEESNASSKQVTEADSETDSSIQLKLNKDGDKSESEHVEDMEVSEVEPSKDDGKTTKIINVEDSTEKQSNEVVKEGKEVVNLMDTNQRNEKKSKADGENIGDSLPNVVATKDVAPLNLDEALLALTKISQSAKGLLEEDGLEMKDKTGLKRPLMIEEDEKSSKRLKHEEPSGKGYIKEQLKKKIKKQLKLLSRDQIEDLVSEKIIEMISSRSEIGELRRKCDSYEQMNEKWKRKTQGLQKMYQDLNTVMRRYILDVQREKEQLAPIKITRSVGLQYGTDRRRMAPPTTSTTTPSQTTTATAAKKISGPQTPKSPAQQNVPSPGTSVARIPNNMLPTKPLPPTAISPTGNLSVSINNSPTGVGKTPVTTGQVKSPIVRTIPQGSQINGTNNQQKKVIDVVDLGDDDDDDVVQPTQPQPSQMRMINTNQRQQAVTYTVVSSANTGTTMHQGINRVILTRTQPQSGSQVLLARNGAIPLTTVVSSAGQSRPPTQLMTNTRPIVIQTQPRSQVPATQQPRTGMQQMVALNHPAPLPEISAAVQIHDISLKSIPPRPQLKISRLATGIVLSWNMNFSQMDHAIITMYQIYAYQETRLPPNQNLWKKVGDVKALPLPMACTLTQFMKGNRYHFAIRAQDVHNRVGPFSQAESVSL